MANFYKKKLFKSDPCLFDLKKTAKDIYINLIIYFYNFVS